MRRAHLVPALSFDLTFPEVFYPTGVPDSRQGFNAVLGNPPWDRMLPADKEFFAAFEFRILDAPTKRERDVIQRQLLADPSIKRQYDAYIAAFRNSERVLDSQYTYQIVQVDGERTIGKQDAFRAFMERNTQLLANKGWTGIVVPSAFHANEGASGVRRLYLEKAQSAALLLVREQAKALRDSLQLQVRDRGGPGGAADGRFLVCVLPA